MRKLTMSRGSYEELVPVEFDLYSANSDKVRVIILGTVAADGDDNDDDGGDYHQLHIDLNCEFNQQNFPCFFSFLPD